MTPEEFINESNRIEGIIRPPNRYEISEFHRFMELPRVTVHDLEIFVKAYEPKAKLRDKPGLNVAIGGRVAQPGGPPIRQHLSALLERANRPTYITLPGEADLSWEIHVAYEMLHPFTDGNGRSGRMLWAWQMRNFPLGFLHHFYYQTLNALSRTPFT